MGCDFCGHDTPHSCWDANEAANCGNYLSRRAYVKARLFKAAEVEKIIERRSKRPSPAQIEAAERRELARLKAKYEAKSKS